MIRITSLLSAVIVFSAAQAEDTDFKDLNKRILKGTEASRLKAIDEAALAGPKGKELLRSLSSAMLAKEQKVRVAAANAMKKIDENVSDIALKLALNFEKVDFQALLKQGESVVEPLVPLLIFRCDQILVQSKPDDASLTKSQLILDCLYSCTPEDTDANNLMLRMLKSQFIQHQHTGVLAARVMKDGKKGISDVLRIAKICTNEGIRLEAIRTVVELTDSDNKASVSKSLGGIRFDKSESVRKEVDRALDKIKDK